MKESLLIQSQGGRHTAKQLKRWALLAIGFKLRYETCFDADPECKLPLGKSDVFALLFQDLA